MATYTIGTAEELARLQLKKKDTVQVSGELLFVSMDPDKNPGEDHSRQPRRVAGLTFRNPPSVYPWIHPDLARAIQANPQVRWIASYDQYLRYGLLRSLYHRHEDLVLIGGYENKETNRTNLEIFHFRGGVLQNLEEVYLDPVDHVNFGLDLTNWIEEIVGAKQGRWIWMPPLPALPESVAQYGVHAHSGRLGLPVIHCLRGLKGQSSRYLPYVVPAAIGVGGVAIAGALVWSGWQDYQSARADWRAATEGQLQAYEQAPALDLLEARKAYLDQKRPEANRMRFQRHLGEFFAKVRKARIEEVSVITNPNLVGQGADYQVGAGNTGEWSFQVTFATPLEQDKNALEQAEPVTEEIARVLGVHVGLTNFDTEEIRGYPYRIFTFGGRFPEGAAS